eukprot:GHVS01040072.1.p1 GENE.GHVS01040072.1~~GHVS01040072.1.p1  ORF type:complete len:526 (-),score=86.05 GHVS01040072.1:78-1655(-)
MKSLKSFFGGDWSQTRSDDFARSELEDLGRFLNTLDRYVIDLHKLFNDAQRVHDGFGKSLTSFFGVDSPHGPALVHIIEILKMFEKTHTQMRRQMDAAKYANAEIMTRNKAVIAKIRERDVYRQRLDHYQKKVERLRSTPQVGAKGERVNRNEHKLSRATAEYQTQDTASRLELNRSVSTKYQEAALMVAKVLHISVDYMCSVSTQLNQLGPHLKEIQEVSYPPDVVPVPEPPTPTFPAASPTTASRVGGGGRAHSTNANGVYVHQMDSSGNTPKSSAPPPLFGHFPPSDSHTTSADPPVNSWEQPEIAAPPAHSPAPASTTPLFPSGPITPPPTPPPLPDQPVFPDANVESSPPRPQQHSPTPDSHEFPSTLEHPPVCLPPTSNQQPPRRPTLSSPLDPPYAFPSSSALPAPSNRHFTTPAESQHIRLPTPHADTTVRHPTSSSNPFPPPSPSLTSTAANPRHPHSLGPPPPPAGPSRTAGRRDSKGSNRGDSGERRMKATKEAASEQTRGSRATGWADFGSDN